MTLLQLPAEYMLANIVGVLICAAIVFICICRLNVADATRWRLTPTQIMYLSFAFWAGGTAVDLMRGLSIGFHGAAGGLGILLHLATTYRHWRLQEALVQEARGRGHDAKQRPLWAEEGDEHAATRL